MRKFSISSKWCFPLGFVIAGAVFWGFSATNFLGILSLVIALLLCCFYWVRALAGKRETMALVLRKCLWAFVAVLVLGSVVTGIFVASGHPQPARESCDYILVLGCTVEGDKPGPILQNRIDKAYAYLTEHPETVAILTGGKGGDEKLSEAQCMFRELTAMGIAPERLWMEENSTSTQENFLFSVELIREKTGTYPQYLGVLSSETHLFRASLYADGVGVQSAGIAAKTANPIYYVNYFLREIPCVWKIIIFGG